MTRLSSEHVALTLAASLCSSVVVVAQPLAAVGSEFQLNAHTESSQHYPTVGFGGGRFVVVWDAAQGMNREIFGRRFDSTGVAIGGEFQVNVFTTAVQERAAVAVDAEGDFVVVWHSDQQDGGAIGIFARRFDSAGAPQGGELQVNVFTSGYQRSPDVAADADGDFVVVWTSEFQDGDVAGAFARRFASTGAPQGPEFQVSTLTASVQYAYGVAFQADGDFVVTWVDFSRDASQQGVFARLYDSAGAPQGPDFQVNATTLLAQERPDLAVAADGDFVVAWESYDQDGESDGIVARRFTSAGTPVGAELQVNTYTPGPQLEAAVAADLDGDFVVTWSIYPVVGTPEVFARRFDSAGVAQGAELQVNTYTEDNQDRPQLASDGAGGFLVVWRSFLQDGGGGGIFGQRFVASQPAALDVDGNGDTDALTDGLLVLRDLFGFTGATLTNGAVGAGCTRCNAAAIEAYLDALGVTLDIDGDGELDALIDGLLILRFLFGFTGTTLTSGAVDGDCTRCDAAAILPYLQSLD